MRRDASLAAALVAIAATAALSVPSSSGGAQSASISEARGAAVPRYPASYFSGPLGRRNPVPQRKGAFLLAWHVRHGWAGTKAGVLERHRAMGRPFDGIATPYIPSERREAWIHKQGALPIIAGWTPGGSPAEIASGARDRVIASFARRLGRYPFVVMVRMFHEFDQEHLSYHACGTSFVAMWRRVVKVVRDVGARNIGFWWSPNEGFGRECTRGSYPGDAYVDWVGSGSYNFCFVDEAQCYGTPYRTGWAEFGEIFDYDTGFANLQTLHDLFGPRKPFVAGETGTVYDPANPARKGDWYRNIVPAAKTMRYLRGVMFFDADASATEDARNNWLVDHPRTDAGVYRGFLELAASPWFNTRARARSG